MLQLPPKRNLDVNLRKSKDHEQKVYSLFFMQAFQNNDIPGAFTDLKWYLVDVPP